MEKAINRGWLGMCAGAILGAFVQVFFGFSLTPVGESLRLPIVGAVGGALGGGMFGVVLGGLPITGKLKEIITGILSGSFAGIIIGYFTGLLFAWATSTSDIDYAKVSPGLQFLGVLIGWVLGATIGAAFGALLSRKGSDHHVQSNAEVEPKHDKPL